MPISDLQLILLPEDWKSSDVKDVMADHSVEYIMDRDDQLPQHQRRTNDLSSISSRGFLPSISMSVDLSGSSCRSHKGSSNSTSSPSVDDRWLQRTLHGVRGYVFPPGTSTAVSNSNTSNARENGSEVTTTDPSTTGRNGIFCTVSSALGMEIPTTQNSSVNKSDGAKPHEIEQLESNSEHPVLKPIPKMIDRFR